MKKSSRPELRIQFELQSVHSSVQHLSTRNSCCAPERIPQKSFEKCFNGFLNCSVCSGTDTLTPASSFPAIVCSHSHQV